jgi:hypothetical protein
MELISFLVMEMTQYYIPFFFSYSLPLPIQLCVLGMGQMNEMERYRTLWSSAAVINLWSTDPWGVRDAYSEGPQLFRKLNNFSQQINKVYICAKKQNLKMKILKRFVKVKEFEIGG